MNNLNEDIELNINTSKDTIKTLIVDDYLEAIDNLKKLLFSFNEVEIIGEALNVKEALYHILTTPPDLIFLDVEMPGQTGFDLINELIKAGIQLPKVIFTTAHGHYAIEALRNNAVDFLPKPIDSLELTMAIQRFKKAHNHDVEKQKLEALANSNSKKRILLPTITGLKQIPLGNVLYFQKENDATENVKIYYSAYNIETIPGNLSLKNVIDMLPEEDFFQIDRRTVINLDYLTDIETKTRKCILNKCDEVLELSISRGRLKEFRNRATM